MRPETNDDYEVLDFIGRGGYGEVFLARDKAGCFWAVKVVYRISFDHERPFEREFEGISKFEPISQLSESQLQILHVGRRDAAGYFYYIMELADDIARGRDVRPAEYFPRTLRSDLQQHKRIAPRECCRVARALAVALENLHQHRLVHRDIKPANIIFVNGLPKLADPGLVTDADKSMTCAGTDGYIPPEGPGSARADIYSLGIVLYEAMTGNSRWDFPKLPDDFEERPDHQVALELNRIINKACHANVRKRYQSARELQKEFDRVIGEAGQNRPKRMAKPARKILLISIVASLVLGTLAYIFVTRRAGFTGRGAEAGTIVPAVAGGDNPASSNVPAGPDGQWQGVEEGGRRDEQALTFTRSPEGKLQAEMKDLKINYTRTTQSLELNANHLKIVFNIDNLGRSVSYDGNIDYAWKRISGMFVLVSPSGHPTRIPLHLDYMGADGNNSIFGKYASPATFASLIGQWKGRFATGRRSFIVLTFTRTTEGNLQGQWSDQTLRTITASESVLFDQDRLKLVLNSNGHIHTFEGNLDVGSMSISGIWTTPWGKAPLRLDYVGTVQK